MRYADLPFFDQFRIPAGRPDEFMSNPTANTHKVVRHLAKEYRYVRKTPLRGNRSPVVDRFRPPSKRSYKRAHAVPDNLQADAHQEKR